MPLNPAVILRERLTIILRERLTVILRERSDRRIFFLGEILQRCSKACSGVLVLVELISLLSLCNSHSPAQSLPSDTAAARLKQPVDSMAVISGHRDSTRLLETKSPWLAVGLSAAVPGLGQIYDKSYWKVPLIWGLGGYWVYEWIHLNTNYKDFRDQYARSIKPSQPNGNGQYLLLRDFYRDERDKFAWYLGGLYLLNLVDAYVGASLYDFDVGPDLTADGRIVPRVRASIRIGF